MNESTFFNAVSSVNKPCQSLSAYSLWRHWAYLLEFFQEFISSHFGARYVYTSHGIENTHISLWTNLLFSTPFRRWTSHVNLYQHIVCDVIWPIYLNFFKNLSHHISELDKPIPHMVYKTHQKRYERICFFQRRFVCEQAMSIFVGLSFVTSSGLSTWIFSRIYLITSHS